MGLFDFGKKKKAQETPGLGGEGDMPPMPESNAKDVFSDLPTFPEKHGGTLMPPAHPDDVNAHDIPKNPPLPKKEEMPIPPQITNPVEKHEMAPMMHEHHISPPKMPKDDHLAPPKLDHSIPDVPHSFYHNDHFEPQREFPDSLPFVKAYELRDILKAMIDLQNSVRRTQNHAAMKPINETESEVYQRWHRSLENLQRKLMLSDKLFEKT